ncbi:hypothetical protein [Enterocloster citroniae]|uniref:hypothetical protein n=1 Tax=Enterocloster citroniae TaxID=358743 RepID=UPI001C01097E|nr:hypothetical protein [Enterocloster citroniae]
MSGIYSGKGYSRELKFPGEPEEGKNMEKIRCGECRHCKEYRKLGNTRSKYTCGHPNHRYIIDYFDKHHISKMPGFLNFGKPGEVPVKTSPAWCPRKR